MPENTATADRVLSIAGILLGVALAILIISVAPRRAAAVDDTSRPAGAATVVPVGPLALRTIVPVNVRR